MGHTRHLISVIVVALVIVATVPAAAKVEDNKWHEYKSTHFTVYSDASPKKARDLVKELELFHEGLIRVIPGVDRQVKSNLTIFAAKNKYSYRSIYSGFKGKSSGVFLVSEMTAYTAINMATQSYQRGRRNGAMDTLFHEYVHFVMAVGTRFRYPPWYREGFAEFMATLDVNEKGEISLGLLNDGRHMAAFNERSVPLEKILHAPAVPRKNTGFFYAQSWLAVHFFRNTPERAKQAETFLRLQNDGMAATIAFDQAFDISMKALDKEIKRYGNRRKFNYIKLAYSDFKPALDVTERLLSPSERAIVLSRVIRHFESSTPKNRAREILEKALRKDPGSGTLQAALGLDLLRDDVQFDAAATHIERAFAVAPNDPSVLYATASMNTAKGRQQDTSSKDRENAFDAARGAYEKILTINPRHIGAVHQLAWMELERDNLGRALELARITRRLHPHAEASTFLVAKVQAAMGDVETAQGHMRDIIAMTHSEDWVESAEQFLKELYEPEQKERPIL